MSVASSMSLSSARSKVDFKVFDRLKQDSEDIDAALNEFLSERNYTLENQVQARLKYEADMKELDNSENHHEDVDHNLMRHLNLAIEGANEGNIDYDDFNGPSFEFDEPKELPPVRRKKRDHPNAIFDQPVGETKKVIPSFNEKIKIREKLLKFFDESRLQELQLEMKWSDCKDKIAEYKSEMRYQNVRKSMRDLFKEDTGSGDSQVDHAEDIEAEEKKADIINARLIELQLDNSEKLKDIFKEYQPQPFSKAWGTDADYIKLTDKLKSMMENEEPISVNFLLDDRKVAKVKKAPKKKFKKIHAKGY